MTVDVAVELFPELELSADWQARDGSPEALAAWGWRLADDAALEGHWEPRSRGMASGEEQGYRFRGRRRALQHIVRWFAEPSEHRPLLVTGSPGVGKSALLARIVTTADAELALALPPDDDGVRATVGSVAVAVHARDKTALDVAIELARAASASPPSRADDLPPALREAIEARRSRPPHFNIVIDALDEMVAVSEIRLLARMVVRLVQNVSDLGVRVVIGSRRRHEDTDLLALFGRRSELIDLDTPATADGTGYFEPQDLVAYSMASLQLVGNPRPDSPYRELAVAERVAIAIAESAVGNFLVAGVVARSHGLYDTVAPEPTALDRSVGLDEALGDYMARLAGSDTSPDPTLAFEALAYAHGRGFTAGLWAEAVTALDVNNRAVDAAVIEAFVRTPAINFLVEDRADRGEPTFRLFHQALVDTYRRRRSETNQRDEGRIVDRLVAVARSVGWRNAPDYVTRNLGQHAAAADRLDELLDEPAFLVAAEPSRLGLVLHRTRTARGASTAGVYRLAAPFLASSRDNRQGYLALNARWQGFHELASAVTSAFGSSDGPSFRVPFANLEPRRDRVTISAHPTDVEAVCSFVGVDGRVLLASAGLDGTVRLWDPATGASVGEPLDGHRGEVFGVCGLRGPDGRPLLASAGGDGTVRLWDPVTGASVGDPLEGHTGAVFGVCALRGPDDRVLLASAGGDCTVRLWDPVTGGLLRDPLEGHTDAVFGICALRGPDDRVLLASAGGDGTVRIWDSAASQPVGDVVGGHVGSVFRLCELTPPDGGVLLASASADETVRIWDVTRGVPIGSPLSGHHSTVWALCTFGMPDRPALLATGGGDGTVRIWDYLTGDALGEPIEGHGGPVYALCAFSSVDGRVMLASASGDGTMRIWDPSTGQLVAGPTGERIGAVFDVCAFSSSDRTTFLATASGDGTLRIWDAATAARAGPPLSGHGGPVWGVCALRGDDGRSLLASGSVDSTVQLWDPSTGTRVGQPLVGHSGPVWGVCATGAMGRQLLISTSIDGTLRVWDPWARHLATEPIRLGSAAYDVIPIGNDRVAVGLAEGVVVLDIRAASNATEAPHEPDSSVQWDVFLAHAGGDIATATELHGALSRRGVRTFLDSVCLMPGDDWDLTLRNAQRNSRVTAVLVSSSTEAAFYEREEIANAIQLSRRDPERHRLVPIYLTSASGDDVDAPYGMRLKHALYIGRDLTVDEAARKIQDVL